MKRNRKIEHHHNISLAMWWADIPENIIDLTHWIHIDVHNRLKYPNWDEIRKLRSYENTDILPTMKSLDYKETLWRQTFSSIERLNDDTILLILESLWKVRNLELWKLRRSHEKIRIGSFRKTALDFCEEIVSLQKERLNLILNR